MSESGPVITLQLNSQAWFVETNKARNRGNFGQFYRYK